MLQSYFKRIVFKNYFCLQLLLSFPCKLNPSKGVFYDLTAIESINLHGLIWIKMMMSAIDLPPETPNSLIILADLVNNLKSSLRLNTPIGYSERVDNIVSRPTAPALPPQKGAAALISRVCIEQILSISPSLIASVNASLSLLLEVYFNLKKVL